MSKRPLARLRRICLSLPEAIEQETWDTPTFRVRSKIFALQNDWYGQSAVWLKAPPGSQMVLVGADPDRYFVPPYLGHKGWVGVRLASGPDWAEVEQLIRRSYRLVAPRKLAALVD